MTPTQTSRNDFGAIAPGDWYDHVARNMSLADCARVQSDDAWNATPEVVRQNAKLLAARTAYLGRPQHA